MFAPQMHGLCFRYIGDQETTKDIVQEGFIKVFSNIKKFKGKGSFEGWIKRIFINTAISHIRKNNQNEKHFRFDEINETNFTGSNGENYDNFVDINEPDEESVLANMSEEELMGALHKVPENFRIVFNLHCIENIKHDEIARILKISVATSRTRLLRARNMLKKKLRVMCHEKLKQ